ncbi:MAG: universal stress protein [Kouleothrix sp.]|jgi:nucleotide-binding universal stress UspA family protein|nr:universal stress protein [Kouleothrix sp.]
MYQRIMVPLDGSELAQTAIDHALSICRAFAATLVLLHVRDRHGSVEASQRYLDFTRRELAGSGVPITLVLREGDVASAIVNAADSEQIDVIAMATHGRSGLQRVVYGSVAEQVLRSSTKPVLLVRVPGAQVEQPAAASPAVPRTRTLGS